MPVKMNTASSGSVTLTPADTASNVTLTVPAQTGTVIASDASGNVGIGTTSTTQKLWVNNGNIGLSNGYRVGFHSNPSAATLSNYYTGDDSTNYLAMVTDGAERMRLDASGNLLFNSGYGSVATAYGCRAWVNFNGKGTIAIRGSGNVSSITDNGAGRYGVNFTNSMPDTNYIMTGSAAAWTDGGTQWLVSAERATGSYSSAIATSSIRITVGISDTDIRDADMISVSIFR